MGYDLVGLNPTNEYGEYFRNNIWSWPPLWSFVCHCCNDILTPEQIEEGYSNTGVVIEAWQAQLIAQRLKECIVTNTVQILQSEVVIPQKIEQKNQALAKLFGGRGAERDLQDNLRKFIEFARASGGFRIY